jgi:hypothetical protein
MKVFPDAAFVDLRPTDLARLTKGAAVFSPASLAPRILPGLPDPQEINGSGIFFGLTIVCDLPGWCPYRKPKTADRERESADTRCR